MKVGEYYICDLKGRFDIIRIDKIERENVYYTYILDSIREYPDSYWRYSDGFTLWRKLDFDELINLIPEVL